MRAPLTTGRVVLAERLLRPAQVTPQEHEAEMPPYMESFLAHLRLLVGVPLEYLVPDPRLLPDESVRFFYVDRSWTDRLVDGAIAVGKIGSREQAHHQAQSPKVTGTLDVSERMVRTLQRGKKDFPTARADVWAHDAGSAETITGLLLRSAAVAGWPHMEVRAYSERLPEPLDASAPESVAKQLRLLRLERLAPGLLAALFEGVPQLVTIEEPHHGVQFGIHVSFGGTRRSVPLRSATGQLLTQNSEAIEVALPTRAGRPDVIHVSRLRDLLQQHAGTVDEHGQKPVVQSGSGAFAIAVLQPPWRQRFEGTVDHGGESGGGARNGRVIEVAGRVRKAVLRSQVAETFAKEHGPIGPNG